MTTAASKKIKAKSLIRAKAKKIAIRALKELKAQHAAKQVDQAAKILQPVGVVTGDTERETINHELKITQEFLPKLFAKDIQGMAEIISRHPAVEKVIGTGSSSAGAVIPAAVHNQLVSALVDISRLRPLVSTYEVPASGMKVPVKTANASVSWVAEGGDISASTDPTFVGVDLKPRKMVSRVPLTHELIAASGISLSMTQVIIESIAQSMAEEEDKVFIAGVAASNQPIGLAGQTFAATRTKTLSASLKADDILDLLGSLDERYQERSSFVFKPSVKQTLRKLKQDNQYVWTDFGQNVGALRQSPANLLLGRPTVSNANVPRVGTKDVVIVGDLSYYGIGDVIGEGIRLDVSTEAGDAWTKDLTEVRAIKSVAGNVLLGEAFARVILN